ncbi:MAG: DNA cytosine methyltransferase [Clostridia bacterium]|nr:DNA cytosine methyltransferase [Clostridia bacterium]MDD4387334.1 DNA cytosine methyltransferase [Clostridia bacterium]
MAGKRDYNDPRNLLIFNVIEAIEKIDPDYVLIENVPQLLNMKVNLDNEHLTVEELIYRKFSHKYNINSNKIINAEEYGVPQNRKRAMILMSKNSKWEFPKKDKVKVTVEEAIGELPTVEAIIKEKEYNKFFKDNKQKIEECLKVHKWHFPKEHTWRHVEIMMHTPTGKSAFENDIYFPKKENGEKVRGYNTTYKRMQWDRPAPTITMANGSISSQCNVHPGRKRKDGTYTDARALTIYEIMRLFTIPDDWNIPDWANDNFIRQVIGEGVPPLLIKKVVINRGD